ncbi:MAG: flagellar basal body-associated FliL family protein [Rhodocyclaceae bacterium]|nr:flagellar basal body-associated FliL family protein [Rhodocyclaceae bacterium]
MKKIEEALYEKVAAEVESNQKRKGLWTKAYAHSGGSTQRAEALYIKLRVQEELQALQDAAARRSRRRRLGCLLWFVLLFMTLFVVPHLINWLGGKEEVAQETHAEHKDPELHDPVTVDPALAPVYIELPPYVKKLDPAEGERFVQAEIVLQVATDPKYAAMIEASKSQINDIINRILATKKPSDIRTAKGQEALSQEILIAINDALGYARPAQPTGPWGPVIAVLFHSLIIQ